VHDHLIKQLSAALYPSIGVAKEDNSKPPKFQIDDYI
jgi:hypothetical protein